MADLGNAPAPVVVSGLRRHAPKDELKLPQHSVQFAVTDFDFPFEPLAEFDEGNSASRRVGASLTFPGS